MIILLVHLKLPPCRWRSNHLGTTPQVLLSFGGEKRHLDQESSWVARATRARPHRGPLPFRCSVDRHVPKPVSPRPDRAETVRSCVRRPCGAARVLGWITRRGRSVDLSFCYEVTGCCTGHEKVTFQGDWFWGVLGSKVYRRKLMKLQRGTDVACSILFLLTRECPARVVPGTICARQKAVNIVVNGTSLYLL